MSVITKVRVEHLARQAWGPSANVEIDETAPTAEEKELMRQQADTLQKSMLDIHGRAWEADEAAGKVITLENFPVSPRDYPASLVKELYSTVKASEKLTQIVDEYARLSEECHSLWARITQPRYRIFSRQLRSAGDTLKQLSESVPTESNIPF